MRADTRSAYWIAFGPHGPRAQTPPGENWTVFWQTMVGVGIATGIFLVIRQFAGPAPRTMNKEWQEATNEYLKVSLPTNCVDHTDRCRMLIGERGTGTKSRAVFWHIFGGLQWKGTGSITTCKVARLDLYMTKTCTLAISLGLPQCNILHLSSSKLTIQRRGRRKPCDQTCDRCRRLPASQSQL